MTTLFVERTVKVQPNQIGVIGKLWGVGHGHVKWIVLAEEVNVPGVLCLVSDHTIDFVELCIDELGNLGQLLLDQASDGSLEPASNGLQSRAGKRDIDVLEVHGGHVFQLPVYIIG